MHFLKLRIHLVDNQVSVDLEVLIEEPVSEHLVTPNVEAFAQWFEHLIPALVLDQRWDKESLLDSYVPVADCLILAESGILLGS